MVDDDDNEATNAEGYESESGSEDSDSGINAVPSNDETMPQK